MYNIRVQVLQQPAWKTMLLVSLRLLVRLINPQHVDGDVDFRQSERNHVGSREVHIIVDISHGRLYSSTSV